MKTTCGVRRKQSEGARHEAEQLQVAATNSRWPKNPDQCDERGAAQEPARQHVAGECPPRIGGRQRSRARRRERPTQRLLLRPSWGFAAFVRQRRRRTRARTPTAPSGAATARPDSTTPARAATTSKDVYHAPRHSGQRPAGTAGLRRTSTRASDRSSQLSPAARSGVSSRGVAPQTLIALRLYDPGTVSARVSARDSTRSRRLQRGGRSRNPRRVPPRRSSTSRRPASSKIVRYSSQEARPISNSAAICSEEASTMPCSSAKSKMPT